MPKPKRDEEGVSRRPCRACGKTFAYPEVGSAATRFHCGDCAHLPKAVRATFEQLTRRINQLEKLVAKSKPKSE